MIREGRVTPGKLWMVQAKAGIVVAVLFLFFGLALGYVSLQDIPQSNGSERFLTEAFFVPWTVACLVIIVLCARLLLKQSTPDENAVMDIRLDAPEDSPAAGVRADFAERLRKLEGLKRDGLVSDAEYEEKRSRILQEKW